MGIDPSVINVRDLKLSRPARLGPAGDESGAATVLASGLSALVTHLPAERRFRRRDGLNVVILAEIFLDPVRDADGVLIPILDGDFAEWTNTQGAAVEPQEVLAWSTTDDCDGSLDVLKLDVGRTTAAGL